MVKGLTVWKEFNLSVFPLLYFHDRYRQPLYSRKTLITPATALSQKWGFRPIKVFSKQRSVISANEKARHMVDLDIDNFINILVAQNSCKALYKICSRSRSTCYYNSKNKNTIKKLAFCQLRSNIECTDKFVQPLKSVKQG